MERGTCGAIEMDDDHKASTSHVYDFPKIFVHIKTGTNPSSCPYPGCSKTPPVSQHYSNCKSLDSRVSSLVRNGQQKRKQTAPVISSVNGASGSRLVDFNPLQKRFKMDHVLQSVAVPPHSEISPQTDVAYNNPRTRVSPEKGLMCGNNTLKGQSDDGSCMLISADKGIDEAKYVSVALPEKPEANGVSLIQLFTPDQVREHIRSLKKCVVQKKPKTGKPQAMEQSMSQHPCQLCGVAKLNFEPITIFCTPCGARIKRNTNYYTAKVVDSRQHICNCCYDRTPGDSIVVEGTPCPKASLEKLRNDIIAEEGWVQCDKCHLWQHQICALFNSRRNEGGQAKFTCPHCYIAQVERGECTPLQPSAVRGAKDLPRTSLSDHLEQRLFKKLKQERVSRARIQGKTYDEVPGAECLVVRVVSSVDKKLEVKKQFFETFKAVNYPKEFAYKSKVVLLFQKIEGVEVCLFGMIVQEFGANCQQPNHRRVNLSYMDSVKYFRPEIKAVTGESLRTFVYHEILIGYLEHCKKRGFTSCYMWACPPIKGDEYIFHCHPEMQKTPKCDELRKWYITMLEKAAKENIVVELTNLHDHFFISGGVSGEYKVKVTAARLPYFDGDYLPGAAEDFIHGLQQEEGGIHLNEKTTNKTIAKRALEEYGQDDLSENATKDVLLMHKLCEAISPKQKDFIMVHLQHSCCHCCILMTSGNIWSCCQCDFRLCDKCYEEEQKLEKRDRHPVNEPEEIHMLYPIEVSGIPEDTQDNDVILGSKFFDTRLTFLELCEGNHYQYDTLRRAKHSSMMLLYHLHNPNVPAFVPVCDVCGLNIETGQGCPDNNMCNACYQKDGKSNRSHELTQDTSIVDVDAQNKEATQQKVALRRKLLDLLVHALQCQNCPDPDCHKMKGLIQHYAQCKTRKTGCCVHCKRIRALFKSHAESCELSQCHVPHCRVSKEQQANSRGHAVKTAKGGRKELIMI
ncbi:Histone acetyltransferase [Heracleum sosnowskyi]|uniref:histone acetyltransferase n=1 Tax=Heracleum sosnowskyi TaxID=360622 RepID=A0AAD8LZ10_9APIA|nr:Histone acetyltransferase [Heracleum sosnowskyi]